MRDPILEPVLDVPCGSIPPDAEEDLLGDLFCVVFGTSAVLLCECDELGPVRTINDLERRPIPGADADDQLGFGLPSVVACGSHIVHCVAPAIRHDVSSRVAILLAKLATNDDNRKAAMRR